MPEPDAPFSRRHGVELPSPPISLREAAPDNLRHALLALAERGGLSPGQIVKCFTSALLIAPEGNWGEEYLRREASTILQNVEWFEVYDLAEALYLLLRSRAETQFYDRPPHIWFEEEFNRVLVREGVGWQMLTGAVEFRGPAELEADLAVAAAALRETGRPTAAAELVEARRDLSRRPAPDVSGSIQHSLAALECAARDIVGDQNPTLGALLSRYPNILPEPVRNTVRQLWGYASDNGRHLREGRSPTMPEAVLVVGVASAIIAFLVEQERAGATSF